MATPKIKVTSNLETPIFEAIEEGRVVLVGLKCRKRVLHKSKNGAFYVNMGTTGCPDRKRYLSQGGVWVITNGVSK